MMDRFRRILPTRAKRQTYALNELDLQLRPYLSFRNGFFVEVGANDGARQSNTMYFEKYAGWKGLLIEAVPALADKCRENRPQCIVENCALVASDYAKENIEVVYCNLMSVVKGGMNNEEEEIKHIQTGMRFLADNEEVYVVSVPARTLSQVLNRHGIEHVDLLSLDVEGYEAQVLRGLDLDRHHPEFMLIEVRHKCDVESIIGCRYKTVAVLNTNECYSDVLYRRK